MSLLRILREKLNKNPFIKNVGTLMAGTALSQIIPVAISPILTRLYSPEDFGILAVVLTLTTILSSVISGKYELAIMLPKEDRDSLNIVALSSMLTVISSFVILIFILVFNKEISTILGMPELTGWLYVIPLLLFLTSINQIMIYWSNRHEKYNRIMRNRILQSTVNAGFNMGMGFTSLSSIGLVGGLIASQTSSLIRLVKSVYKEDGIKSGEISWGAIKKQAKKYSNFPKYLVFSTGIETASSNLPNLLFTRFFGLSMVGHFSLTKRVLSIPLAVFSKAVGDIFLQRASKEYLKSGSCEKLFKRTTSVLFLVALIPFLILFFKSEAIFGFVFGEEWRAAGKFGQYLSVPLFLQFVTSPVSHMFIIAEKQKLEVAWQICLLVGVITSLLVGFYYESEDLSIILYSATYSLYYMTYFYKSYKLARGSN